MQNQITLTSLPPEALLTIAEHLLPADRGCLVLCSQELLDLLFKSRDELTRCFRVIAPDDPPCEEMNDTRVNFLTQLSKDLPGSYLCAGCLNLHNCPDMEVSGQDDCSNVEETEA